MADDQELEGLKSQLAELLAGDATDFQEILRLSAKIGRLEPDIVRFTTDAAMVRRLGRELVAKQETALAELVKNAYDADATECTVRISGDAMEIIDDGSGMNRAEIENGFMRLASDAKVNEPLSRRYHRSRAGRKGIGRFATERLGEQLTILTQTAVEPHGWKVTVDWSLFEKGLDLNLVANAIEAAPKEKQHGTRLIISGLNDVWVETDLKRVYRYLSTLLEPLFYQTQLAVRQSADEGGDPGFKLQLHHMGQQLAGLGTVVNADSEILGKALAVIDGIVDAQGKTTWSLKSQSERVQLVVKDESISVDRKALPLAHARNVSLKAYYYIRRQEFLGHSLRSIGNHLDENGGIRLYRNGYRVPPYGEKENDWLGLDAKKSTWAPISTKTFIGYVTVSDIEGDLFEETSSREGLIETSAFQEVRAISAAILEAAVRRIESTRGKGRNKKTDAADSGRKSADETDKTVKQLEGLVDQLEETENSPLIDEIKTTVAQLAQVTKISGEKARERDDFLKELNLLRILASMGLTIAEFTHDFTHFSHAITLGVRELRRSLDLSPERLEAAMEEFEDQATQVHAYTAHLASMMTNNANRELENIDLYEFAREFRKNLGPFFDRRSLDFTVERPDGYDIFTTKMHRSEWSSILLNLLTNALKAVGRAQRAGRFQIRVGHQALSKVFLEFSDNGDGIPVENRTRVFDAFFTTSGGTGVRSSETVQSLGTGLGLKIVADLVSSANGTVRVADPRDGFSTTIRIEVPAAKPGEIDGTTE